jgi:hypothetical protein
MTAASGPQPPPRRAQPRRPGNRASHVHESRRGAANYFNVDDAVISTYKLGAHDSRMEDRLVIGRVRGNGIAAPRCRSPLEPVSEFGGLHSPALAGSGQPPGQHHSQLVTTADQCFPSIRLIASHFALPAVRAAADLCSLGLVVVVPRSRTSATDFVGRCGGGVSLVMRITSRLLRIVRENTCQHVGHGRHLGRVA